MHSTSSWKLSPYVSKPKKEPGAIILVSCSKITIWTNRNSAYFYLKIVQFFYIFVFCLCMLLCFVKIGSQQLGTNQLAINFVSKNLGEGQNSICL